MTKFKLTLNRQHTQKCISFVAAVLSSLTLVVPTPAGAATSAPQADGFGPVAFWVNEFGTVTGWQVEKHPRMLGDVNGDGSADVVGFGTEGTYVSTSMAVTYRNYLPNLSR